jgi:hypothetical protein
VINPTLTNSFVWGFTRQSFGVVGDTDQPWNTFLGLDQGIVYSHNFQVNLHNLKDDLSWTKKTHAFQFGAAIGLARDPRTSFQHSNNLGLGTTNWTSPIGFSFTSSTLDPTNIAAHPGINLPEPLSSTAYDRPLLALYGMISDVVANYNLDKNGKVLPPLPNGNGAPVKRNYGLNSYEFYGQDTWRIKPNFTLTYGLRWSFFPPPWETNGLQTAPTFGLGTQFAQNVKNMNQGLGYTSEPAIAFALGGPANNGSGFYNFEKTDWSPRVSFAYSPRFGGSLLKKIFGENDKTVIRAGFSRVYDRAGFALLNSFDQIGSAGLTTTLQNACCTVGVTGAEDLPRITGINTIPPANINGFPFLQSAPSGGFPQIPPVGAQANLWGIDNTLKTPHAYAVDFSIGRELPKRFSLQISYVGRFGRDLLTQRDLNQPLDIVDPKSGIDYYRAASALSNVARNSPPFATYQAYLNFVKSLTDANLNGTAAYWHDMLPQAAGYQDLLLPSSDAGHGVIYSNVAQAVYDLYYNPSLSVIGDEIVGLADIDSYGGLGDNNGNILFFNGPPSKLPGFCPGSFCQSGKFLSNQAFSQYAWSSIGSSTYHALQASLRKQFSHGVQFDFNYTFSKSTDITSAASRVGFAVYGYTNIGLVGSRLANAFSPNLARAVSDYDLTHQMNLNWIVDVPVGKGRALAHNASGLLDAFIGGWQVSGLARWTSGFPYSVDGGQRWPTDWFLTAIAQMTARPKTGIFKLHITDPVTGKLDAFVSPFANPAAAQNDFTLPLPGGVGSRNVLRGDGFASWDTSLSKRWKMPYRETHNLQFRWEVFNVPNLTRFNAQGVGASLLTSLTQSPASFGAYTSLLTQPRVMQFALRYEF